MPFSPWIPSPFGAWNPLLDHSPASSTGLCFHLFVVLYEEPHLHHVFGSSYEDYRARVGRWLPGIGRLTGRRS